MRSGIKDFDTADPNRKGKDVDPFRATVYSHPSQDFLEPYLLSVPWVALHKLAFEPGTKMDYSTTNFGLLGLVLAHHAGVADYRNFNQSMFIPSKLAEVAKTIQWVSKGSPRDRG